MTNKHLVHCHHRFLKGLVLGTLRLTVAGVVLSSVLSNEVPALAATDQEQQLPREGELLLKGTVTEVDEAGNTFTIEATLFTLPNGKSGAIAPSKFKTIVISAQTVILRAGTNLKVALAELQAAGRDDGPAVTVTGVDGGGGKPFSAREVEVYGGPGPGAAPPAPPTPAAGTELTAFKVVSLVDPNENSSADATNAAGDVAGYSSAGMDQGYLFLYRNGKLEKLTGPFLNISGLGAHGEIIGQTNQDAGVERGAYMLKDGKLERLQGLDYATGINSSGLICGENSAESIAVIYANHQMLRINNGTDEKRSSASAVNDAGQIVGSITDLNGQMRPFIAAIGKFQRIETPDGKKGTATAISSNGLVVGNIYEEDHNSHAFLYDGTRMTELGTLGGPDSSAYAVNDSGQVVGTCVTGTLNVDWASTPFLYDHGKMKNLNSLLQDKDWVVKTARSISNDGQIAATAMHQGKMNAVHLIPVAAGG